MSARREAMAFVMGAVTGHALATARQAKIEAKLARCREALRWSKGYVSATTEPNARKRADEAWEDTAL